MTRTDRTETIAANEHRRTNTSLAGRPAWIRIGERLGLIYLTGVDSYEGPVTTRDL